MDEQRRRMAGPFVPLPGEIFDLLEGESAQCFKAYAYMLYAFFVEQDPDVEGEWVLGRIQATRAEIGRKLGRERSWFKDRIWPRLKELGLVRETEDGAVELPKLYKKAHQYLSPLQVTRQLNLIMRKLDELDSRIGGEPPEGEGKPRESEAMPRETEGAPRFREALPRFSTADILLKGSEEGDIEEEEEGTGRGVAKSQKNEHKPGSREWIIGWLDEIWGGRGYQPHIDDDYIEELEKFPAAWLQAVFENAQKEKIDFPPSGWNYIMTGIRRQERKSKAKERGGRDEAGKQHTDDSGSSGKDKRRHKGSRKTGKGRVGRERWPEVE